MPPISLEVIRAARERIAGAAIRTPLIALPPVGEGRGGAEVYVKLEVLQPIGSFKIRGAANAMAQMDPRELARGVVTASAGNMAQGVAWNARRLGVPCTVVAPEHAPDAKVREVERLGGRVLKVPFDEWWQAFVERLATRSLCDREHRQVYASSKRAIGTGSAHFLRRNGVSLGPRLGEQRNERLARDQNFVGSPRLSTLSFGHDYQ